MRIYKLPEEFYLEKVKEGERGAVAFFLVTGILILSFLYAFQILTHWIVFVIAVPLMWLLAEGGAILARRQKVKQWFDYEIGYEKDVLHKMISGVVELEMKREDVEEVYEEFDNLILKTRFGEKLSIPIEIEQYDDLRVRLLNWNRQKKTYNQIEQPEVSLIVGPAKISLTDSSNQPDYQRRRKTYQETRMADVREARRKQARNDWLAKKQLARDARRARVQKGLENFSSRFKRE